MIERNKQRGCLFLSMGLLLGAAAPAMAQQQTQGYHPYGYYQSPQPGGYQWAPRSGSNQAQTSAPSPAQTQKAPSTPAASQGQAQVQQPKPQQQPQAGQTQQPGQQVYAAPMVGMSPQNHGGGSGMPGGMRVVQSRLGPVLADAQGHSLYFFDRETAGIPICEGDCARSWPPFLADGGSSMAAPFFLVPRGDGARQWAWNGRPLYRWIGDREEGDVTGDGINGVWHAVRMR